MRSFADFLKKKRESDEQMGYYRNCMTQNELQMRDLQRTVNGILSPNYSVHNPSPFTSKLQEYERENKKTSFQEDDDCEEYFLHSGVAYSPKGKVLVKHISPSRFSQSNTFSSDSSSNYSSPYKRNSFQNQKQKQQQQNTTTEQQQNILTPSTEINLGEEEEEEQINDDQQYPYVNQEDDGIPYQYQYNPSSDVPNEEEQNSEESLSFLYQGKTMKRYESKDSLFVAAGSMENLYERSLFSSASQRTTPASSILGLNRIANDNEYEQDVENENVEQPQNDQEYQYQQQYNNENNAQVNDQGYEDKFDKYQIPHVFNDNEDIVPPQNQHNNLLEEEEEEEEEAAEKPQEEHRFTQFSSSFEEEEILEPNTTNNDSNLSKQQDKQTQTDLIDLPRLSGNSSKIKEDIEDVVNEIVNEALQDGSNQQLHEEEEKPSSDISRSDDSEEEAAPENARDDAYYAIDEEELQ